MGYLGTYGDKGDPMSVCKVGNFRLLLKVWRYLVVAEYPLLI
jgi:hypothetical protein